MCGITGWISLNEDIEHQRDVIESMTDTLYWRGPDTRGVSTSKNALLGHRRLIVIDPEGGKQPMHFSEGNYKFSLVYNGELYNFEDLKEQLKALGHSFETRSDTEVVLRSYLEWGVDCVKHFNGIFAFAIWDDTKKRLFLARDHLGVKPLFYFVNGGYLVFGSEIKSILENPLTEPEIDQNGLSRLFTLSFGGTTYAPTDTVYKDIKEVRPGHIALFDSSGLRVSQYWKLQSREHEDSLEVTVEKVRELLFSAINRQLVADKPVVSLLSGGLDSSGVASVAANSYKNEGKGPLSTYSMDFTNSVEDFEETLLHKDLDTPWAKKVSEYAGTNHHIVTVSPEELIENIRVPYRSHDIPGGGEIETSLYLLFKHIKKDATVALSGESADEVFGGYPWFFKPELFEINTFPWMLTISEKLGGYDFISSGYKDVITPQKFLNEEYEQALSEVPRLKGESKKDAKIREQFYFNITRFLPLLLNRKDRMSMATGLEVRVPFCDYKLVEYVWNIPWEMKTVGNIEKGLLRKVFKDVLPEGVVNRKKSAYPFSSSPLYLNNLHDKAKRILDDPQSHVTRYLDRDYFSRLLSQIKSSDKDKAMSIRVLDTIFQIENWMEEYKIKTPLGCRN